MGLPVVSAALVIYGAGTRVNRARHAALGDFWRERLRRDHWADRHAEPHRPGRLAVAGCAPHGEGWRRRNPRHAVRHSYHRPVIGCDVIRPATEAKSGARFAGDGAYCDKVVREVALSVWHVFQDCWYRSRFGRPSGAFESRASKHLSARLRQKSVSYGHQLSDRSSHDTCLAACCYHLGRPQSMLEPRFPAALQPLRRPRPRASAPMHATATVFHGGTLTGPSDSGMSPAAGRLPEIARRVPVP
jgi:hypothetical protein